MHAALILQNPCRQTGSRGHASPASSQMLHEEFFGFFANFVLKTDHLVDLPLQCTHRLGHITIEGR